LLSNEATKVGVNKKLMKRWKGPYIIHDLIGEVNYIIKPVDKKGRKTTVHRNRLKRCYLRTKSDTDTNQPIIKIEEEEGVSVEDTTKTTTSISKNTATSNTEVSQQTPTEIFLQESLEPKKVLRRSSRISKVTNRFNPSVINRTKKFNNIVQSYKSIYVPINFVSICFVSILYNRKTI
jgi:hypothetical protein